MKIKIGVILGGATVEHEVSIITAVQAMGYMDISKYDIYPIYIDKSSNWYTGNMLLDIDTYKDLNLLKKYAKRVVLSNVNGKFLLQTVGLFKKTIAELDLAFPIVHGNNAEDGSIQGYLKTVGIPFVGSDVLGSAVAQDKVMMKQVFKSEGINIVDYIWFYDNEYVTDSQAIISKVKDLGYPVVVKPASLGSSIGINYVKDETTLEECIEEAIKYDVKIIVEKAVNNLMEINCAVLGTRFSSRASILERVNMDNEMLTFKDKYLSKGGKKYSKCSMLPSREIPAKVDVSVSSIISETALKCFRILNLSGVCRFDFLVDSKTGEVFINEPNTIPGSLSFYIWHQDNLVYEKLIDTMIEDSIKIFKEKSKKISTFDSNILSTYGGIKGVKGKI